MKVAAFADCHIGRYGKRLDEQTGLNARLVDMVESLRWMCEAADQRAGALLFAGDMFRTAKPDPTELVQAGRALRQWPSTIYGIAGNHDLPRASGESAALTPLEGMGNLEFSELPCVEQMDGSAETFQLAMLPYPNRSQLAAAIPDYGSLSPEQADEAISAHLAAILQGFRAELNPGVPSILLAHISVDVAEPGAERGIMAGRDITIPLSAIPEEFTFAVLGHIHYAQDFGRYGRPNVFYCGSTDRIDFGEEGQEKSFVVMDTEAGTWERVPIPCREYRTWLWETDPVSGGAWTEGPDGSQGAICRVRIRRPENARPDYAALQREVEEAGCADFRGFVEVVDRVSAVRSEEIEKAQSLPELLGVWHQAKGCDMPLAELVSTAEELERTVAA